MKKILSLSLCALAPLCLSGFTALWVADYRLRHGPFESFGGLFFGLMPLVIPASLLSYPWLGLGEIGLVLGPIINAAVLHQVVFWLTYRSERRARPRRHHLALTIWISAILLGVVLPWAMAITILDRIGSACPTYAKGQGPGAGVTVLKATPLGMVPLFRAGRPRATFASEPTMHVSFGQLVARLRVRIPVWGRFQLEVWARDAAGHSFLGHAERAMMPGTRDVDVPLDRLGARLPGQEEFQLPVRLASIDLRNLDAPKGDIDDRRTGDSLAVLRQR